MPYVPSYDGLFVWSGYADEDILYEIEQLRKKYLNDLETLAEKVGEFILDQLRFDYGIYDQISEIENIIYESDIPLPQYEKALDRVQGALSSIEDWAEKLLDLEDADSMRIWALIQKIEDAIKKNQLAMQDLHDLT